MIETPPEIPRGHQVNLEDGRTIAYHEAGQGPAVIFVHGSGPGGSGWSNFQGNYKPLAQAGFRALVPDLLGYGYSSKPEDAQYTLDYLTQGILDFADALGLDQFALVGNSLGGAICIRIAIDHPQRVTRMLLMAPGGLEAREVYMGMKGIRSMLRAIFDPEGLSLESMRKVFSKQLHDPSIISEALLEQRLAIARTQPQAVFATSRVPNQADELHRIQCPVLALWGEGDQFCPVSGAQTLKDHIANIEVQCFADCGHWVMVEHEAVFNRMMCDFLQEPS
jgi:4,5:9,10-diseco-3-hydroxy-5,9,17-trioxoandrosta-1(10),2-diene-4-oate hydrolase